MTCCAFDGLGLHLLLLGRFQVSVSLGFLAHALHGVHHVVLCARKALPRSVVHLMFSARSLTTSGKAAKPWIARVPILLLHCGYERLVFQVLVLGQPLLQLNHLQRIGGGYQRLAE